MAQKPYKVKSNWVGWICLGAGLSIFIFTFLYREHLTYEYLQFHTMTIWGSVVFCGGLGLIALQTWKDINENRQSRIDKEKTLTQIERLAKLREQKVLTEEEFSSQKRKILDE